MIEPVVLRPSGVVLDPSGRWVRRPDGTFELTPREATLLAYLVQRPWVVVQREELLREVWRVRPTTRTKALEMCVRRLRERIELDPDDPQNLLTVRGGGYRFVPGAGEAGATSSLGPARSGNVPADVGSGFVGRDEELARIVGWLGEGARLVTVIGPAGVGKSRLAREVGRTCLRRGGVWLVDLGEERTAGGLLLALARTLGITGDGASAERVAAAVAARGPMILVLDAAEGCAEGLGPILAQLGDGAPDLQVLATSRRALPLRGAIELRLDPLAEDPLTALLAGLTGGGAAAGRARWARSDPMRALAARLEGLPLAAVLAAGRLRMYTCEQLLARLDEGWGVLRTGGADRHASLHDALLVSWEILEAAERDALGQLSVFRGGFTLEAARAVLSGPDADERVQGLLDASLLRCEAGSGGPPRFRLFDAVRELASERVEPALLAQAEERHAAWFLPPLDPPWPPRIPVDQEDRWLDQAENLVAATERCIVPDPPRAVVGLARLWQPALQVDLETLLRLARACLDRPLPDPDRALALLVLADATALRGRQDALALHDAALELAQRVRPALVPWVRLGRVSARFPAISPEAARSEWSRALSEARTLGDRRCEAHLLRKSAEFRIDDAPHDGLGRALALYREVGDELGEATAEAVLGMLRALAGRPAADGLLALYTRWTALSRQRLPHSVLRWIAMALLLEGRPAEGRAWAAQLRDQAELQGAVVLALIALELQGWADLELGHLDAARMALRKVAASSAVAPLRAAAEVGLGLAAHADGEREQALVCYRRALDDPEQRAVAIGLSLLAGGGEETRTMLDRLRREAEPELVHLVERVAELDRPEGTERLEQWASGLGSPSGEVTAGLRVARIAARLLTGASFAGDAGGCDPAP